MSKSKEISPFVCNGASNHSKDNRSDFDFYCTPSFAGDFLIKLEPQINNIWECFVGSGTLAEPFRKAGKLKAISDLIDRGYHPDGILISYGKDFLNMDKIWKGDIVSNPPYSGQIKYVKHCLELIETGKYLALFLKLTFLEGKERKKFFEENPPIRVWVSSSRILCAKNGVFKTVKTDKQGNLKLDEKGNPVMQNKSSACCYAWFVWQKGYKGDTIIKWFN